MSLYFNIFDIQILIVATIYEFKETSSHKVFIMTTTLFLLCGHNVNLVVTARDVWLFISKWSEKHNFYFFNGYNSSQFWVLQLSFSNEMDMLIYHISPFTVSGYHF